MLFDPTIDTQFNEELFIESQQTLIRLKEKKKLNEKEIINESLKKSKKLDRGRTLFEEFDLMTFEGKMKVDMLFYEYLLSDIEDDTVIEGVQNLIGSMYANVKQIYEHINILPEIFGIGVIREANGKLKKFKLDQNILNESMTHTTNVIKNIISKELKTKFYDLSLNERKAKYFNEHKELAKNLIIEGNTPEDAISFSVKNVIIENFLRKLAFPFAVWSRVNYLCESDDYGKIFDQDKLDNLVEQFNKKLSKVSKVITAHI